MPTTDHWGARLRAARDAAGLSGKTIALKCGVSLNTLYAWEARATPPDSTEWLRAVPILATLLPAETVEALR